MSEVRIVAEPRTEFGKGAARRVRRAGKVPAVLYGHGDAPRHVSLPGHELMLALKHDANVLLTLDTEQGDQLALPRAVVRDPIKGFLEHLDLVAVRRGEKVTVDVPVVLTGDARPDVLVDQQLLTVSVEAEATHLPSELSLSIEGLAAGQSITAGTISLPAGTTLAQDPEQVVVQGLGAGLRGAARGRAHRRRGGAGLRPGRRRGDPPRTPRPRLPTSTRARAPATSSRRPTAGARTP